MKVAVIDPESANGSALMEEARKFMIATFYREAVVPQALNLTGDNDEMRRVFFDSDMFSSLIIMSSLKNGFMASIMY